MSLEWVPEGLLVNDNCTEPGQKAIEWRDELGQAPGWNWERTRVVSGPAGC